jgi:phage tail sheath protein FI
VIASRLVAVDDAAPGLMFWEANPPPGPISAVRTDIAAFVGMAERGPVDDAVAVESWDQFAASFGGFIPAGYLAYAVRAFFENGGRRCRVVRVASPAAATAGAVVNGLDGRPALKLQAKGPGRWGNRLTVVVGPTSPGASPSDPATAQPADLGSSVLRSVAGFTEGGLVRVSQYGAGRAFAFSRVIESVDALRRVVVWTRPLDPAYDPTAPATFEAVEFSLSVLEDGVPREVYAGLSLSPGSARFVSKVLEEQPSPRIAVTVEDAGDGNRLPEAAAVTLEGGLDGLADLAPSDFTGDLSAEERRGLRSLELVDEVAIVAVPDAMVRPRPAVRYDPPAPPPPPDPCVPAARSPAAVPVPPAAGGAESPPALSPDDVRAIQLAQVRHCEARADRVALLDVPDLPGRGGSFDVAGVEQWRRSFDSTYAACYGPWIVVDDALQLDGSPVRAIPPCGHVAGVYAQVDLSVGVHRAPANVALVWARDVAVPVGDEVQAALNPIGVNCIRTFAGRGIRPYGARTASADPSWRFVNVRRLLLMIETAVRAATQWAVFEPHDPHLRELVRTSIGGFLTAIWQRGALTGGTAAEAFFVRCDDTNNPPDQVAQGRLLAEVGVAPVRPAEFVVFTLVQVEDALEVRE